MCCTLTFKWNLHCLDLWVLLCFSTFLWCIYNWQNGAMYRFHAVCVFDKWCQIKTSLNVMNLFSCSIINLICISKIWLVRLKFKLNQNFKSQFNFILPKRYIINNATDIYFTTILFAHCKHILKSSISITNAAN